MVDSERVKCLDCGRWYPTPPDAVRVGGRLLTADEMHIVHDCDEPDLDGEWLKAVAEKEKADEDITQADASMRATWSALSDSLPKVGDEVMGGEVRIDWEFVAEAVGNYERVKAENKVLADDCDELIERVRQLDEAVRGYQRE